MPDTDTRYLGVLTLLGRVAKFVPIGHEDRYGLDRAFTDANAWLEAKNSSIRYDRSGKGYAAFERPAACSWPLCSCRSEGGSKPAACLPRLRAPPPR